MSSSNTEPQEVLVTMPQMGVSVAEGTLALWHKQVGDWVEKDETICEISTDKIDTEVPSPAAGRVSELIASQDEVVPVGGALARIATGAAAAADRTAEPGQARQGHGDGAVAEPAAEPHRSSPAEERERAKGGVYSPVVQRIAAEHDIDLADVHGTGRGGRVRKQDVLAFLAGGGTRRPAGAPASSAHNGGPAAEETPPEPAGESAGPQSAPLSRMRRAIAEHMTRSLQTAAHCTTIVEADFSGVEEARARLGCSPLPFVARAVVDALHAHSALNATLEGEMLTTHRDVNLGIAVSLGERGLIVPVIPRAQELSVRGLAARIEELARRARAGELTPDEVRGGTFTITNPGGYGSIASTPIINQPQVAILDLEAVVKRPVAVSDADGRDALAIRPMAFLCLSWDHRALDGALAAQFLATVRRRLEGADAGA